MKKFKLLISLVSCLALLIVGSISIAAPPVAPTRQCTDAEVAAGTSTTPCLPTPKQLEDNDATGLGGDQLVDIVATSPLKVNAGANVDNALPGSDADITFNMPAATNASPGHATAAQITAIEANTAKVTNTDDQNAGEVTATDEFANSNSVNVQDVLDDLDQAITDGGGGGTDDQTIDVLNLDGTTLQVSLEGDGEATQEVDLAGLQDGTGSDDQTAAEVTSTATGNIEATDVDSAIAELESEKQPTDADLIAIAALACTEDQIIKRNGAGTWICAADDTGSGSLGSNLASTTNDITSDNNVIQLIGNSEDLDVEFGANSIDLTTDTGVTEVDIIGIDLKDDGVTLTGVPTTADISDVTVTQTELEELATIGATTISADQWAGLGGATTAGMALWDDAAASNQRTTLGIDTAANLETSLSLGAYASDILAYTNAAAQLAGAGVTATASEINTPLDGASVTLTEFQELETIGATTVSADQWGYVGDLDQALATTDSPTFAAMTLSGHATPGLTGQDSDDDAGTFDISGTSSGGENAIIMTFAVEEDDGFMADYIEVDGVSESIDLLKNVVITGSQLGIPSGTTSPASVAGAFKHDTDLTGLETGALAWYDGDEIRYVVDVDVLPTADGQINVYDQDLDIYVPKAMSGDATMAETGEVTIATDAVTMDSIDADGNFTSLTGNWFTTGTLGGRVAIGDDATNNAITQAEMNSTIFDNDGDTWTLADIDAADGTGWYVCFYASTTDQPSVDPDAEDKIRYAGTLDDAGDSITAPAEAGAFVCLVVTDFAGDVAHWTSFGTIGTWTAN